MKKNQNGFGAVEALLILVIIGLIGFVGWYVYDSGNKTKDTLSTAQTISTVKSKQASLKTYTQPKDPTTSFKYPSEWKLGSADGPDVGDGTKNVMVTSPSGAELALTSAGAGIGGDCQDTEHSKVTYAKKIPNAPGLYVVEWELLDGTTSLTKGLDVLNGTSQSAKAFTEVGDQKGCITAHFRFSSSKANQAGYFFGLNRGEDSKPLSAKDSLAAKQILGSLSLQ